MQQAVAHHHLDAKVGGIFQPADATRVESRKQKSEPRNLGGEGIDIHAGDRIKRALHSGPRIEPRFMLRPEAKETLEGAKEKMARPAGWIDEPHLAEAELADSGVQ